MSDGPAASLTDDDLDMLEELLLDPVVFIETLLHIQDKQNRVRPVEELWPHQVKVVEALCSDKDVLVLKARQQGVSTIVAAVLFWMAFTSPDGLNCIGITHEGDAVKRLNQMYRVFIENLPDAFRPALEPDNKAELGFRGSLFKQTMAGGRSQGRSYTYQLVHATEMGFWPRGSSAREGKTVDEDAWSSIMATIDEDENGMDNAKKVIESTAETPTGLFYKMVLTARDSDEWEFLFFPWFEMESYRKKPPDDWERTPEEQELAVLYGLDDRQLCWRRNKIVDQGYGLERFQKEYPSNWMEPFLVLGGMWFDTANLNQMAAQCDVEKAKHLTIYEEPRPGRRYVIGADSSGGVGKDQAVAQVLDDAGRQVAVYADRNTAPRQFAEELAKLSIKYGRAQVLIEENNTGRAVLKRCAELGTNLWTDPKGKYWWMDPRTKTMVYSYAREMVDGGHVEVHDGGTVEELLHIREQRNGNIEADEGYSDDRADALALALWAARSIYMPSNTAESRDKRIKRQRDKMRKW